MILLYKRGISVNTILADGNTGLHFACYFGALECTAWLLQNDADYLIINSLGQNALEISAANSSSEQFRLLLEYTQVDPNQRDSSGKTLLHLAVKENCLKHVMILIMHGASLDFCDSSGFTPLHIVVRGRHQELIKLLLFCGANSNLQTVERKMPIDLATENDSEIREIFAEL